MAIKETSTITMSVNGEYKKKARIIAANLGMGDLSKLFRHFIDTEWQTNYQKYEALTHKNSQL